MTDDEWEPHYRPTITPTTTAAHDSTVYGPDRDGTQWRRNPNNPHLWEYREINSRRWTVYGTIPLADLLAPETKPPVTIDGHIWHHTNVYGADHHSYWYCDTLEQTTDEGDALYEALTLLARHENDSDAR